MRSSVLNSLVLGIALAVAAGSALADPPQSPQSVSEILQVQHNLRQNLDNPHGEYGRFSQASIDKMKHAQDKVFSMLNGVTSLDQLNDFQKTDLSNALDEVKAVLLANEGNRQICHRERKTGTNLVSLRCETMAEREANAKNSQEAMREMSGTMQTISGH